MGTWQRSFIFTGVLPSRAVAFVKPWQRFKVICREGVGGPVSRVKMEFSSVLTSLRERLSQSVATRPTVSRISCCRIERFFFFLIIDCKSSLYSMGFH